MNRGTRECSGFRAIDGEDGKRFELTFSSEEPYERYFGPEILSHEEGAVNLSRLQEIGCVLFNHDRDRVIGRVDRVWIEDGRAHAEITFDDDEKSEIIRQKVIKGSLKGVSVSYTVEKWEVVKAGSTSSDKRFNGPCYIARGWTPLEISIVSVPADPTVGVGRMENGGEDNCILGIYEKQVQVNKNFLSITEVKQ